MQLYLNMCIYRYACANIYIYIYIYYSYRFKITCLPVLYQGRHCLSAIEGNVNCDL